MVVDVLRLIFEVSRIFFGFSKVIVGISRVVVEMYAHIPAFNNFSRILELFN